MGVEHSPKQPAPEPKEKELQPWERLAKNNDMYSVEHELRFLIEEGDPSVPLEQKKRDAQSWPQDMWESRLHSMETTQYFWALKDPKRSLYEELRAWGYTPEEIEEAKKLFPDWGWNQ